jgi:hypothetical protein
MGLPVFLQNFWEVFMGYAYWRLWGFSNSMLRGARTAG